MNQREKILIGIAIVVALAFGLPMVVSAFGSSDATEATLARMHENRKQKERQAEQMLQQTKELRPQVERLAWNLPPEQLRQEIVRKVSNVAQAANVNLVTTRPIKPRPLDVMTEVSVELHITTSQANLVRFLYPLQTQGSRLSVDRIRIAANTGTYLLDVDLTVSGYTLQTPTDTPANTARSNT